MARLNEVPAPTDPIELGKSRIGASFTKTYILILCLSTSQVSPPEQGPRAPKLKPERPHTQPRARNLTLARRELGTQRADYQTRCGTKT